MQGMPSDRQGAASHESPSLRPARSYWVDLEIETERLVLRPPIAADLDEWAANMADEEAMRHLGGPSSRPVAWRNLAATTGSWVLSGYSMFSVIEKSSARWVGRLGPWRPEGWPGREIGWGIARGAWGKGYAREGVTAAIDWAFDHLAWPDILHCIEPANGASIGLARRLGSEYIGTGRLPEPLNTEVEIYGQTREQWMRGRGLKS